MQQYITCDATCARCGCSWEWVAEYGGYGQYYDLADGDRCPDCGWWADDEAPVCEQCGEYCQAEWVPPNWNWYCPTCRGGEEHADMD